MPHYGLGVFFVLAHLASGARVIMLSHGVARRYADRFLVGSATAAGFVALVIMFGMCGRSAKLCSALIARIAQALSQDLLSNMLSARLLRARNN
jgi:hypothetical protein